MPDPAFFNNIEPLTLEEIASISNCEIYRNHKEEGFKIKNVAPLDTANDNEITFFSNSKYANSLASSKAAACIIDKKNISKAPENMAILVSDNPYLSYAKIATAFNFEDEAEGKISEQAFIDKTANIGKNCNIEAGAFIGKNSIIGDNTNISSGAYINKGVKIGNNCHISHGATISHSMVGDNVIIHAGVKIGQDGFGYATDKGQHVKVPQLGRVIIKNNVEIGANSCIDRGAGPDTVIGEGTKIDNLVQIGHNVQIGRSCIIVSHVGISGSTKLGDYVVLGGQVGVAGHLNIGNMVNVAAQSGVAQNIEDRQVIGGSPAVPIKQWHRQTIALKKLTKKRNSNDK